MKVIGEVERGDIYICQISHREVEKFMNLYYNKMDRLKVGDEVDLGKGHDFFHETKDALSKTREFIESNKDVIDMIVTGISIMTRGEKQ